MTLFLLFLFSTDAMSPVVDRVVGTAIVACAKSGMTPEQVARIAYPDRGLRRPDPAGSILYFWYEKYHVLIAWNVPTMGRPAILGFAECDRSPEFGKTALRLTTLD